MPRFSVGLHVPE